MKISEIKELIQLVDTTGITELEFAEEDVKLIVKKGYPTQSDKHLTTTMSRIPQTITVEGIPLTLSVPALALSRYGLSASGIEAGYGLSAISGAQVGYGAPAVPGIPTGYGAPAVPGIPTGYGAPAVPGIPTGYGTPTVPGIPTGHGALAPGVQPGYGIPTTAGVPAGYGTPHVSGIPMVPTMAAPVTAATPGTAAVSEAQVAIKPQTSHKVLKAPMVGTFYSAPRPDAEPFVHIGDRVKPGQTMCIIEAMKLMNQIEAEFAGIVVDILQKDGDPVEYGQNLFVIDVGETR